MSLRLFLRHVHWSALMLLALLQAPAFSACPAGGPGPFEAADKTGRGDPKDEAAVRLDEEDSRILLVQEYKTFFDFPRGRTWRNTVPEVRQINIPSTLDGQFQPAMFYDSGSSRSKPLLVVLHSWSTDFTQPMSIPYALWCVRNDWVFIHPEFRGMNTNSKATGSDQAVQDIVDAVDFAKATALVDPARVYCIGFSGGAMSTLIMAGRHPDLWTAVSAWVPVYDLRDFYTHSLRRGDRHYPRNIVASCGGVPTAGRAAQECRSRSPSSRLAGARGREVKVHVAAGIQDDIVPPSHALRAFNELAEPGDRVSDQDLAYINANRKLPSSLEGDYSNELYSDAGKPLVFERTSANVTVTLFKGGHDVLFNAGLVWLDQQRREAAAATP